MISSTLAKLGEDLRRAAARRAYAEAGNLAVRAGTAAAEEARTLPAGDPGITEIAAWLRSLYESAEILLRIGRAAQADEFRRLVFLKGYLPRPDEPTPRVRLQL